MKAIKKDEKLYIQTFRAIRTHIIRNGLKAGDLLPTEQEMSQTLGVSRNVLREAIKSMELMGMIQASPGKGTVVREFSLDFVFQNVLFFTVGDDSKPVREMFAIRRMLELSYMRQAFYAMTDDDVTELRRCLETMKSSLDAGSDFARADHQFHMTIFRHVGNSVLISLMEAIWTVDISFQLEQKEPHLADSIARHEAIVEAVERYDFRAFGRAMEEHFSSGKYATQDSYVENV